MTLAQVAKAAGVSLATASYALRNDPRISPTTTARVLAMAERLGYQPNPRISDLMTHIRNGKLVAEGERIAFLWIDAPPGTRPYLAIFDGAKQRADQLGYALEEFWRCSPGLSDHRLEQILQARGIHGVLISPGTFGEPRFKMEWNWDLFSPVVIGTMESDPELNHAAHHHYGGMRLAMLHLQAMKKRRIVGMLDRRVEERARRPWTAAFLAHHPMGGEAWNLLLQETPETMSDLAIRIQRQQPDAIVGMRSIFEVLFSQGWSPSPETVALLLDWGPNSWGFGGIDQFEQTVAANSVDLLADQLHRNEMGIPKDAKMLLSVGRLVGLPLYSKRSGVAPQ